MNEPVKMKWVYSPSEINEDYGGGCPGFCDEGWVYDCIDGCCVDPESGCELCGSRCDYCWDRVPA